MNYKVTLTTVASITVTVDADNEDAALDVAHERGDEFAAQYHAGHDWTVDINTEWQLHEPTVEVREG